MLLHVFTFLYVSDLCASLLVVLMHHRCKKRIAIDVFQSFGHHDLGFNERRTSWHEFQVSLSFKHQCQKSKRFGRNAVVNHLFSLFFRLHFCAFVELGLIVSFSFMLKRRLHDVSWLVNSVMGSLVAISGGAPIVRPWQALVIGAIASVLVLLCIPLMRLLKIDDPTENFVTHGVCGLWGLIAIGLFPEADNLINYTKGSKQQEQR